MNLTSVQRRLVHWYKTGRSIYLKSPPGRGKSETIAKAPKIIGEQLGLNLGLVIVNAGMLTPMDVLGFGLPDRSGPHPQMVFTRPFFWLTDEGKGMDEYDGGILFLDELDKADPDVKKVLGEAALSGRLGPHRFPNGWRVWGAGNRATDRSGSTKELDHLINRRVEIEISDDINAWLDYAHEDGVMPVTRAFAANNVAIVFQSGVPEKQGPWCTPRSLVEMDRMLRPLAEANGGLVPDDIETVEEINGSIGDAAGAQYMAYVKLEREMPSYEKIVAEPKNVPVPTKPDAQMLVVFNLAHRVTSEHMGPVVEYVQRMSKEFATTFIRAACKRQPTFILHPAIDKWVDSNTSLMAAITGIKS